MGWKRGGFIVTVIFFLAVTSIALAWSRGADPGRSGGRFGALAGTYIGANCTECHGFNGGTGRVELLGAPARYRPGRVYDLTVRVLAPDEDGAGFEISAEGWTQHAGSLQLTDEDLTQFTDTFTQRYVTHTGDGVNDSVANWAAGAGGYEYDLRWQAPGVDVGPVTFFVAVNALRTNGTYLDVRYYADRNFSYFAVPGDADGDTDLDLFDFAAVQRCFDEEEPFSDPNCAFVDALDDGMIFDEDVADFIVRLTGPTTTLPGDFLTADPFRGGLLYDQWWDVLGTDPPGDDHPLYPPSGPQSGPTTYRCKECHGWDYLGRDGAYGIDNPEHYTGFVGIRGTTLSPRELFNLLASNRAEVPNGHDMRAFGMTDRDLWDVVRFTLEGTIDTDEYVDTDEGFLGDAQVGQFDYGDESFPGGLCIYCHGPDGDALIFPDSTPLGTLARQNPWEVLHKLRYGRPGSPMPSMELLGRNASDAADIGAYLQTLPD